jgi:hypothetical protein
LDSDTKIKIVKLIKEYENIFVHGKYGLGCTDVVTHKIDVQGSEPVRAAPYRVPHALREVLNKSIKEMVDQV